MQYQDWITVIQSIIRLPNILLKKFQNIQNRAARLIKKSHYVKE